MLRWKDKLLSDVNRSKFIKNGSSYLVLFLAMGSMVFFGICNPGKGGGGSSGSLSGAAAKVASETISDLEFRRAYAEIYARYQKQFAENFDPALFELSKMVLNQLVDQRVIVAEARGAGIYVSDEEIEKIIQDAEVFRDEAGRFSGENFDKYLKRNQYSEASFSDEIRRSIATDKFRRFVQETYYVPKEATEWSWRLAETKYDVEYLKIDPSKIPVSVKDEEVKAFLDEKGKEKVKEYYEKNKAEFNSKQKIKARHVLIAFDGTRNASAEAKKRPKDEAKKTAEHVAAQAALPGADFAALATKFTDDTSGKSNGGDLGFFEREAMVKEFSEAAFAMKEGETSQPIESPFGYHVIKVEKIQAASSKSLEEATPAIARKLVERELKPKLIAATADKVLEAIKSHSADATSLLAANSLTWEATGPFAADARTIPGLGGDANVKEAVLSLKTAGQVHPAVISSSDARYIVRLKSLTKGELSNFPEGKRQELAESSNESESYALFNALKGEAKKGYEKDGKIWVNKEFENLDQQRKLDKDSQPGT